jgi:hypothetical protein
MPAVRTSNASYASCVRAHRWQPGALHGIGAVDVALNRSNSFTLFTTRMCS